MIYKTHLSAKDIKLRLKETTEPHWKLIPFLDVEYSHFLVHCGKRSFVIESMYPINKRHPELLRRRLSICIKGKIREKNENCIVELSQGSAMSWRDALCFSGLTSIILGYCYSKDVMDLPTMLLCLLLSLVFAWAILNGFARISEEAKDRRWHVEKFLERVLELEKTEG